MSDAGKHRIGSDSVSAAGFTAERFRQLVEDRFRDRGLVGRVAVNPTQTSGLALVSVGIESGPSILFGSAEWVAGPCSLTVSWRSLPVAKRRRA